MVTPTVYPEQLHTGFWQECAVQKLIEGEVQRRSAIPLLPEAEEIEFLDTTEIHVEAIIDELLR